MPSGDGNVPIGSPLRIGVVGPPIADRRGPKLLQIVVTVINGSGAVVPNATIDLYDSALKVLLQSKLSGSDGTATFYVGNGSFCRADAYLPGSPDTFGTTINTLVSS